MEQYRNKKPSAASTVRRLLQAQQCCGEHICCPAFFECCA
ncbi:hypothetical protein CCACVL1_07654 [Corchorus capsularis]|uniref:Uncharacterized protein n=1 Tax=Corchorus capsularis TaxID=210143 RepID=A0A1R3J4J8_COCAP|nr:hypothetical protein CCACVL1_07654 [Corchorus capsularis]